MGDGRLLLLPEERFLAVDVVDLLLLDVAVVEPGRSRGGRRLEDRQGNIVVQLREVPLAELVQADGYVGVDSFTTNLAFNCNLPATVLFAKAGDALRYKPAISPLYPKTGQSLDSITPNQIVASVIRMLASYSKPKHD